ncbi:hypothetical protein [Leptospira stimsonii]|uniref:Uncharacterized protein n=1 Tax=Leptospira stimsonii TaxID=2202203 RepID=A0A396YS66_9LEPT|nr:hypothetical protein [Leptospira stimsonii]RHX84268.1 hypothetical protein DLM75_23020 [Leptospira stimsonii]
MKKLFVILGTFFLFCSLFLTVPILYSSQSPFSFWKSLFLFSQAGVNGEDEICNLSVLELGDGGWMKKKPSGEPRPVLMEYILTHCQK